MHAMKISLKEKFDVGFMEKLVTFETKGKNVDKKKKTKVRKKLGLLPQRKPTLTSLCQ
jgi:hypothetical protein